MAAESKLRVFEKKIKIMLRGFGVVLICSSASGKRRLKKRKSERQKRLTIPEIQK